MRGVICPSIHQLKVIKCVKDYKYLGLLLDSVVQKWLSIEVSGQLKRGGSDAERQAMSNKPPGLQKDMMRVICASIGQLGVSGTFRMVLLFVLGDIFGIKKVPVIFMLNHYHLHFKFLVKNDSESTAIVMA